MPIGAIIGAGASLVGSFMQADSARDAGDAQAEAANNALKLKWKMFKIARRDLMPYARTGKGALSSLSGLYGLGGTGKFNKAMDRFYKSPDYRVALREGIKGIDSSAAARGGLLSGANMKAITNYSSDLASQKFGNYMDRLYQMAGLGENAAAGQGNAAMSAGNSMGQSYLDIGEAQASGIMGAGNAMAGGLSNFGNNIGQIVSSFQQPQQQVY